MVGCFVLAVFTGILGFTMWLSKSQDNADSSKFIIYFSESITGLNKGGSIRYRGVQVGQVQKITIDTSNMERIKVIASISNSAPINKGTRASLKFQGVTGLAYIELTSSTKDFPPIEVLEGEEYPVIESVPSDFQKVVDSASQLAANLSILTERASDVLSEDNIKSFSDAMKNISQFTDIIVKNQENIDSAMTSLAQNSEKLSVVLDEVAVASKNFSELAKNSNSIIKENKKAISNFSGTGLNNINNLVSEARRTNNEIQSLTRKVNDNPSEVIFPPERKGYSAK